ncbi:hypothetical protein PR202_ga06642 [Eleusine coracana subsp. coracana]|uniref:Uncharacterized protein n=1 Tax=Eleusine coracana subsp. coracana TaxID=191504 RepID=A0AAV5BYZ6_ELECO|nr:hypothetical protein PR202_ga06642 [Eleusine coracana subsp. coracana]
MAMGRGPTGSSPQPSSSATTLAAQQHSSWQSPVPYLFGGLAAMLGLIALSLLALACSYWKLSGSLSAGEEDDGDRQARRRAGDGGEKGAAEGKAGPAGDKWRDHLVVIMAGDERPTFLAMPASGRADDDGAAASCVSGGSEQGRCVECGARAAGWLRRRRADEPRRAEGW